MQSQSGHVARGERNLLIFLIQHLLQLFRVFPIPGLADHSHVHAEEVRHDPSPLVHDVLYRDIRVRKHFAKLRDFVRSIGYGHCELQKPAFHRQSPLQTPDEDHRADVSAGQRQHHSTIRKSKGPVVIHPFDDLTTDNTKYWTEFWKV